MASYARIFVYVILLFILSSTILLLLIPNWSLIQNHRLARMILGPRQRPNIIFILADDLGYNDVGYHDPNVLTPNIDSLSSHGITLDNYYTLCICSASRGVILTGRYDIHNGMRGIATQTSKKGISLDELLISDILHTSGYSTYYVGKWHVGKAMWQQTPTWRGFDYFYGMLGGASDYFTHFCCAHKPKDLDWSEHIGTYCTEQKNCSRTVFEDDGIYSTHLMSDKAIEIIRNETRNPETRQPFFIFLGYQAIHSPPQVPDTYKWRFNDSTANSKRRVALAMINCMDEGIGNITAALKKYNAFDNTLIVFTSDNGAGIGTGDGVGGENWPLRGGKHSIYEGGTKVPAIIHYPAAFSKGVYRHLFHSSDWFPTLVEAAGIELKNISIYGKNHSFAGHLSDGLDGKSHWRNMHKPFEKQSVVRKLLYYGNDNPNRGGGPGKKFSVRYNQFKLLYGGDGGKPEFWYKHNSSAVINSSRGWAPPVVFNLEVASNETAKNMIVYNIEKDPFETTNIYENNSFYQNITKILNAWKHQLESKRNWRPSNKKKNNEF